MYFKKGFGKFTSFLLSLSFIFSNSFVSFAENINSDNTRIYGDVTMDGEITAADAALVLAHVLGKIEMSEEQIIRARVTGNKIITANDAAAI